MREDFLEDLIIEDDKDVITKRELIEILKKQRILFVNNRTVKESDMELVDQIFAVFSDYELTRQEVWDIINGMKKKEMLSTASVDKYVSIRLRELLSKSFSETDRKLYLRLAEIDKTFKSFFREKGIKTTNYTRGLRECWKLARRINGEQNSELTIFTEESLETLTVLANLYRALAEYLPNQPVTKRVKNELTGVIEERDYDRILDWIIAQRLGRLKDSSLKEIDLKMVGEFGKFLETVTDSKLSEAERFTEADVEELLNRSIISIKLATASKYEGVSKVLNTYFKEVKKLYVSESGTEAFKQFETTTVKSVILNCSSILQRSPQTVGFTLDMLTGKTVSESVKNIDYSNLTKSNLWQKTCEEFVKKYPNLTIQPLTLDEQNYFINQPSYLYTIGVSELMFVTDRIVDIMLTAHGQNPEKVKDEDKAKVLKKFGFDINTFFTADNITCLFNGEFNLIINKSYKEGKAGKSDTFFENAVENIKVLEAFISVQDLHDLLAHHSLLLFVDTEELKSSLARIMKNANGDYKIFQEEFQNYVNSAIKVRGESSRIIDTDKVPLDIGEKSTIGSLSDEFVEVKVKNPFANATFDSLYEEVYQDLIEIGAYVVNLTNTEIEQIKPELNSELAKLLVDIHTNENFVNKKYTYKKLIRTFGEKLSKLASFKEFDAEHKKVIKALIEEILENAEAKKTTLVVDKQLSEEIGAGIVAEERAVATRDTTEHVTAKREIKGLIKKGIISRARKEELLELERELEEDRQERTILQKRIKDLRKDGRVQFRENFETSARLATELEYFESVEDVLHAFDDSLTTENQTETKAEDLAVETPIMEDVVEESTVPLEISEREQLEREIRGIENKLELQNRELMAKFGKAFAGRRKNLMAHLDELENPLAKRLVKEIRQNEKKLEKLKAKLAIVVGVTV